MGKIASINFKKSVGYQVFHNSTSRPKYAIGGKIIANRNGYEALRLKEQIINQAIETYNEKKAPKAPKFKATSYEWSAVCNIKEDTTMQDLERLVKHFEDKYGFQCYQIAIHRDEGHIDDNGEKVINHHAHLEFITLDKNTGKSMFRADLQKPKALSKIQDEVAEILKMERGVDKKKSKRKRIEPRIYAQIMEELRKNSKNQKSRFKTPEDFQKWVQELKEKEPKKGFLKGLWDKIWGNEEAFWEDMRKSYQRLEAQNQELEAKNEALKAENKRFNELLEANSAKNKNKPKTKEELWSETKERQNATLDKINKKNKVEILDLANLKSLNDDVSENTDKIEVKEQNQEEDLGIHKIIRRR
jgi:hypothetical protein